MTAPVSTIIGNNDDVLDGSGNGSAISFLRAILAALGGSAGGANRSTNITTATTTLVKTGAGVVKRLTINTAGAGSDVILYDSLTAAGTKLGTFSTAAQNSFALDIPFSTGLTAKTENGSAADITLVYQ